MGDEGALPECTSILLRNPDKLAEWLSIADKHMQSYAENPKTFLMPRTHAFLEPLIGAYALNLDGFTQYLTELRDNFDRSSAAYKDVQRVYRRINGRYIQQQRRERMDRAVAKATDLYGEVPFMHRMQWMAALEHRWANRRLDFLEANRQRYDNDRLPSEDRAELLAEFWEGIDNEIYEGNVPNWNLQNPGATQP